MLTRSKDKDSSAKNSRNLTNVWKDKDKELFLRAVKAHGVLNINSICKEVPNHTKKEIEDFIKEQIKIQKQYKVTDIMEVIDGSVKCVPKSKNVEKSCIDLWLDILFKSYASTPKYFNPLSFCMKLIADFGEHTSLESENSVDFPKMYMYMSHILQGVTPCQVNRNTELFLQDVLEELAAEHQHENRFTQCKALLSELEYSVVTRKPSKYGGNGQSLLAAMQNIQQNKVFNPFDIPLDRLTDAN